MHSWRTALAEGAPNATSAMLSSDLREEWRAMSKDEQRAATEDHVKMLEDRRTAKTLAPHNAPLSAFQDVRATIASFEAKVSLTDIALILYS